MGFFGISSGSRENLSVSARRSVLVLSATSNCHYSYARSSLATIDTPSLTTKATSPSRPYSATTRPPLPQLTTPHGAPEPPSGPPHWGGAFSCRVVRARGSCLLHSTPRAATLGIAREHMPLHAPCQKSRGTGCQPFRVRDERATRRPHA